MVDPDWGLAILGGALIGAAAGIFFWVNGRIAGVSGIFGDLLLHRRGGNAIWRLAFTVGLVCGYLLIRMFQPELGRVVPQTGWAGMVIAGLLVGYGVRLSNGCTSGHGVCGLARISRRSLAATATFMLAAMLTATLARHLWGSP